MCVLDRTPPLLVFGRGLRGVFPNLGVTGVCHFLPDSIKESHGLRSP